MTKETFVYKEQTKDDVIKYIALDTNSNDLGKSDIIRRFRENKYYPSSVEAILESLVDKRILIKSPQTFPNYFLNMKHIPNIIDSAIYNYAYRQLNDPDYELKNEALLDKLYQQGLSVEEADRLIDKRYEEYIFDLENPGVRAARRERNAGIAILAFLGVIITSAAYWHLLT